MNFDHDQDDTGLLAALCATSILAMFVFAIIIILPRILQALAMP